MNPSSLSPGEQLQLALQKLEESENKVRLLQETTGLLEKHYLDNSLSKFNRRFLSEFSERFSSYDVRQDFFRSLVQYIADITRLDYVFVGKTVDGNASFFDVITIAVAAFGQQVDNIRYSSRNGPCEQVIRGTLYAYPEACRTAFPGNPVLEKFNVEGYLGYPLFDTEGNSIGLIAVMHQKAIRDHETISSILRIAAKRAENEMERLRYEEILKQKNDLLKKNIDGLEKINAELRCLSDALMHDLHDPLRGMHPLTERGVENEEGRAMEPDHGYFRYIDQLLARMHMLIDELLHRSRAMTS